MPKYFITKYALSSGIEEIDIPAHPSEDGYLSHTQANPWRQHFYNSNEWHRSEADAVARAEEMRTKKISSLKKQIAKLEKMTFGVSHENHR